jgi:hypothetical protein
MDFQPTYTHVPSQPTQAEVVRIAQAPPAKAIEAKASGGNADLSNVLKNVGAFQSIALPANWTKNARFLDKPYRALTTFDSPSGNGLHITVVFGNLPIEPSAHKVFVDLLAGLKDASESSIFKDSEAPSEAVRGMFTTLEAALGAHHVGDNQLVLSDSPHPPSFHISQAVARKLNGNDVLVIDGYYQDESFNPLEYTRVVFALSKDNFGHEVHHVAIAGKTQADVNNNLPLFDGVLNSIVWSFAAKAN